MNVGFPNEIKSQCEEFIQTHYGDEISSLGVKVGWARFMRLLLVDQLNHPLSSQRFREALPSSKDPESLHLLFLEKKEEVNR